MIEATPAILLALALLLTGPVPDVLGRARWTSRTPRAALALWQAVALAAVLSALGAGASAGTLVITHPQPGSALVVLHGLALLLTLVVLARLLWSAHTLGVSLRARRRRQRELIDLVGRVDERVPGARIVDVDRPLAYCIPGMPPRVVVSTPAVDALGADELKAVLEHERAHARARHDLVLEGFSVLHNAFPRFVRSRTALEATAGLVEMLADDAAWHRTGEVPLARALVRMADAPVPAGSLGTGVVTPAARIRRLGELDAGESRLTAGLAYAAAAALVVVPTLTVALPWLTSVLDAVSP